MLRTKMWVYWLPSQQRSQPRQLGHDGSLQAGIRRDLVDGDEAAREQIEDIAKAQGHDGAGEDDDVVGHAEVRGGEREQETGGADVDAAVVVAIGGHGRNDADNGGGNVEAAVGVRGVLGVAQNGLFKVVGKSEGGVGRDDEAQFEVGAAFSVDGGLVVSFFDGVGGGGGEVGAQGVQVGLHEPGEKFQVDEFDGVSGGGVAQDGLGAAAFLAMAVDGACGEDMGQGTDEARMHLLFGEYQVEGGSSG